MKKFKIEGLLSDKGSWVGMIGDPKVPYRVVAESAQQAEQIAKDEWGDLHSQYRAVEEVGKVTTSPFDIAQAGPHPAESTTDYRKRVALAFMRESQWMVLIAEEFLDEACDAPTQCASIRRLRSDAPAYPKEETPM